MKTKTAEEILIERFGIDPNKSGHDEINTNCVNVIEAMEEYAKPAQDRLDKGWGFLMQVDPKYLTAEDCLEAFGFRRNGLGDAEYPTPNIK